MTPEQFAEFLNYVKENNSWGENMGETIRRHRTPYKYINAVWDSRDNTVFSITLREGGDTEGRSFRVDTPQEIKALYDFIDSQVK
jgi:hypothetical protein